MEVRPHVDIDSFKAVGENFTTTVEVEVSNNSNNSAITLTLSPASGTGTANFTSSNSTTMTITATTNVEIKGITESSTNNNMKLEATFNNDSLDDEDFTVIDVTLALRTSGSVSTDNAARTEYSNTFNSTSLGHVQHATLSAWENGVELVGTILPSNYSGTVILKRDVLGARQHNNMTLTGTTGQGDDTSLAAFRDDNPQSGNSGGKVYDLDAPGVASFNPVGTIIRLRANFREYATVDGIQVSSYLAWYSCISVRKTQLGHVIHSQIANDNQAGTGSINLTWDLQP